LEANQPHRSQALGAVFEEEEGGPTAAGSLAAETQECLELYELAGYQVPSLAGPARFSPTDITCGQD